MRKAITSSLPHDAAAGLRLLDANPDIKLLFTDVVLPGGMNGRQLADEALRRRPNLRVLYTTGYTAMAIIHHGRLDADVDLLTTPFTSDALAKKVRQILDLDSKDPVTRVSAIIDNIATSQPMAPTLRLPSRRTACSAWPSRSLPSGRRHRRCEVARIRTSLASPRCAASSSDSPRRASIKVTKAVSGSLNCDVTINGMHKS